MTEPRRTKPGEYAELCRTPYQHLQSYGSLPLCAGSCLRRDRTRGCPVHPGEGTCYARDSRSSPCHTSVWSKVTVRNRIPARYQVLFHHRLVQLHRDRCIGNALVSVALHDRFLHPVTRSCHQGISTRGIPAPGNFGWLPQSARLPVELAGCWPYAGRIAYCEPPHNPQSACIRSCRPNMLHRVQVVYRIVIDEALKPSSRPKTRSPVRVGW